MNAQGLHEAIEARLRDKHWASAVCQKCGRRFLSQGTRQTCQSHECLGGYAFTSWPARRHPVTPRELLEKARAVFSARGFASVVRDNVRNRLGDTDLIIAALQYYDAAIYGGQPADNRPLLIAQPSIRLQFLKEVSADAPLSSSFVNLSTTRLGASLDEFGSVMDAWLEYLSSVGLHTHDLVLVTVPEEVRFGAFQGHMLEAKYGGLELGEIVWFHQVALPTGAQPLLEFGFGFERILLATNKRGGYHIQAGSLGLLWADRLPAVDALRTLVLLAASGIRPGARGPGFQMRRLAQLCAPTCLAGLELRGPIAQIHAYWSLFITPRCSLEHVIALVTTEIQAAAAALLKGQGIDVPRGQFGSTLPRLVDDLVHQGTKPSELANVLAGLMARK